MPSIISVGLAVQGDLICEGDIQVEGSVQGDVKSHNLTIGQAGSVTGTVEAETVQVSGAVRGQIRARSVTLARTARVLGNIWYEDLVIEAGARLKGTCKRLDAVQKEPEPKIDLLENQLSRGVGSEEKTSKEPSKTDGEGPESSSDGQEELGEPTAKS